MCLENTGIVYWPSHNKRGQNTQLTSHASRFNSQLTTHNFSLFTLHFSLRNPGVSEAHGFAETCVWRTQGSFIGVATISEGKTHNSRLTPHVLTHNSQLTTHLIPYFSNSILLSLYTGASLSPAKIARGVLHRIT